MLIWYFFKEFPRKQYWYQKRRIWCWFWIRWKSCKKVTKKEFWLFTITFFQRIFLQFFNGFELSIEFCVYDTQKTNLFLLILALFANFKAKTVQNDLYTILVSITIWCTLPKCWKKVLNNFYSWMLLMIRLPTWSTNFSGRWRKITKEGWVYLS